MELLCVLAAVAALFCGCTVLTLKCRVPASVAPLTALSLIVAVLTLAAMAGVLYPITWAVYALCLAGGVWVLATRKNHAGAAQKLFTPGSVLFWGMALAFTVYFFVRQPMATDFDELSLWATAVKITKVNNDLYATAELPLCRVLAQMELAGCRVDRGALAAFGAAAAVKLGRFPFLQSAVRVN